MPFYADESVTLYCGLAVDVLAEIGRSADPRLAFPDVVLTDPPYDEQTHKNARSAATAVDGELSGDLGIDFAPVNIDDVEALLRGRMKRWAVCFSGLEMLGDYRRAFGPAYVRGGFWSRHGAPQFTGDRPAQPGEGLAILHNPLTRKRWNGGGRRAFYECPVVSGTAGRRVHPTQKPEALMCALVLDFSDPGELILDPYAGSGTTLVSAKRLGRRAVGIEACERYCVEAVKRLSQQALPIMDMAERELTRTLFGENSY